MVMCSSCAWTRTLPIEAFAARSKKLLSDQLKDSPTGLCSKSFFSRAVCPNDS